FAEQLKNTLSILNDEQCVVVEMKLAQCNNQEVADKLLCSERTVRRISQQIRKRLQDSLLESQSM
ncbi:MAG: sigma-70 family RNA polymerase sigma factor, partial [Planctomycetales bacterium]|nr:sigma-70 family RNA polymerase sigma factor [Planctomycetales bacterium]